MPFGWFGHAPEGTMVGVLSGAATVVFAYSGFQHLASAVEEARNPQRDVPIGMLTSLAACTLLYIAVSGLLTAIAPYTTLNVSSPIAFALLQVGVSWGSALVAVGVIVGLTSAMLVSFYTMTRILFAMARDGLMPTFLGRINANTRVPVSATILCGVATASIAGLVPLGALAGLRSVTILAEFALVCGGVVVLRLTRPDMERPFKIPGGLILPILGALFSLALIGFLPAQRLVLSLLWLAVGVVVYFVFAARRISPAATPIFEPAPNAT
jgi:APA family basic amino acid/polyamine antiporter